MAIPPDQLSTADTVSPVGHRVASSAAWMVLARITVRSIGLVSTLVLVRLLAPDDFGIVAMAGATAGLLDLLSAFSFDLALVQAKTPNRSQFDTVWTLNVLRGLTIAVITAASAPLMAATMNEPRIESVMYVLALAPVLQGFENIALINWQRDLNFDRVFRLNTCGKLAGLCLVVPAAVLLGNYWALVIGQIGASVVVLPLGYWICRYRPRFRLSAWRPLLDFSKWLVAGNLLSVIERYSAVFLISRLFGSATLGFYQVATEIGFLPASEVAAPIRRPMYAGYAQVADDPTALRKQFIDGFGLVLMIVVPLSVGLAVTADSVTPLCLGPKWAGAAPLITISALWALFDNLGYVANNLYIITGAQARFACMRAITDVLRIALMLVCGVAYGVVGALLALLFTAVLACIVWFGGLLRLLEMRWSDLGRVAWRTVLAALTMTVGVRVLAELWPPPEALAPLTLQLGSLCLFGAAIHIAVLMSLWAISERSGGPERLALDWLRSTLRDTWRLAPASSLSNL